MNTFYEDQLDQDRKVLDNAELGNVPGASLIVDPDRCAGDLYYVLVEKNRGRRSAQSQ